ncbi:MAG: ATP-binding cassette domain-containing protein, partial [Chloroflexi bacterium]|nr:ATP-binding cassette domain-containing protein [Chloroflexota bacterium]
LSGGQRQRVALGRAIVREPQVFLMDEPLSNLDAKLRVQTRSELIKLHRRLDTTFIYVTHDQVEAMTMASRIAVMRDGILQQLDTPQNLYDKPANQFVAGFIGSPAMNFFDCTVVGDADGRLFVDSGTFRLPIPADKVGVLKPYLGKEVVLGVRPEHVYDPLFAPGDANLAKIKSHVDVVEPMGSELNLYLVSGTQTFVAVLDNRTKTEAEQSMDVALDLNKLHFFDSQTKKTIR